MISHIRPQCHKLKREENHVARSLPKKPNGPKHIICHNCSAFGHLRPYCSKFHALKRIKRKEKLELIGSCVKKSRPDLSETSMLLKKVFNAFNSLTMCISGSRSSNPRLTSYKTLILNNHSVWMRKGSYGWAFCSFGPWSNSFDLCRTLHALNVISSCIFCILHLFICIGFFFILLLCFSFVREKNPKPDKKWKIQKVWSYMFEHMSHMSLDLYLCAYGFVHLRA